MYMKKFIVGLLVGLIMATSVGLYAENIDVTIGGVDIYVDGKKMDKPILRWNGNAYIPLREVLEETGSLVYWNEEGKFCNIVSPKSESNQVAETPVYVAPTYTPPATPQPLPDNTALYQTELAELDSIHQAKLAELNSRQASAQAEYDANKNLPSTVITEPLEKCPICSSALKTGKSFTLGETFTRVLYCYDPHCPNYGREVARASWSVPAEAALRKYDSAMAQIEAERQSAISAYNSVKQQLQTQFNIY